MADSAPASITSDREETKYLVSHHEKRALVAALNERLPRHRHRGEGENNLPGPEHFVTTVYFDTPSLAHFREATRSGDHHVKLRAKEYYDVHPSLAELATDADEVLHRSPYVWLELKRRAGSRSQKQRVRLERRTVPSWLSSAPVPLAADGDAPAILAYCQSLTEPLVPSAVVNYRRASWQSADDSLRVTLDTELAFFEAPPGLWNLPSLSRSSLGRPRQRETELLIEIKRHGCALPAWLARRARLARARAVPYSKFVRAIESVRHG